MAYHIEKPGYSTYSWGHSLLRRMNHQVIPCVAEPIKGALERFGRNDVVRTSTTRQSIEPAKMKIPGSWGTSEIEGGIHQNQLLDHVGKLATHGGFSPSGSVVYTWWFFHLSLFIKF